MTVQQTNKHLAAIAVVVTVLGAMATIAALAAISTKNIQNHGEVKTINVGVYWNSAFTNETSIVDWGKLQPGASGSVTLYVRNGGTVPVKLGLTTQNWNPLTAANYVALAWNVEGRTVNAGSFAQATLTLSVLPNVTGITKFSFDIIVTGVEQ